MFSNMVLTRLDLTSLQIPKSFSRGSEVMKLGLIPFNDVFSAKVVSPYLVQRSEVVVENFSVSFFHPLFPGYSADSLVLSWAFFTGNHRFTRDIFTQMIKQFLMVPQSTTCRAEQSRADDIFSGMDGISVQQLLQICLVISLC